MTPETTQLGLLKTLAAQDEEIKTLRAQVAQYRDPQTIITLALAYAATRAHDGHLEPAPILGSSHFWGDFWGHLP